jgi:hypothetical protein
MLVAPVKTTDAAALASLVCMLAAGTDAAASRPAKPEPIRFMGEQMKGPFASLTAACARCHVERTVDRPAAPFLDVRVVVSDDVVELPTHPNLRYLAVRLPSGWWLREIGGSTAPTANSEFRTLQYEQRVDTADVLAGGGAEVLVETEQTLTSWDRDDEDHERRMHICGVGPSGRPSCFSLHTAHHPASAASWERPATFRKDGVLFLGGETRPERCQVRFP